MSTRGRGVLPPPLSPGARVRVVAPSSPAAAAALAAGLELLRAAGLQVEAEEAGAPWAAASYLRGSDAERLAALQRAVDDPGLAAIWAARGGYGATRLLPGLDASALAARPKWLVGFSDVTALHAAWARQGVASLHAANVATLPSWSPAARAELFGWLQAPQALRYRGTRLAGGGQVRGRLWGGNLAVIASLCGSGALPALAGAILFLEDVGERPYRLDRTLTQLRQAGVLAGVRAVALGQLTDCAPPHPGGTAAHGALLAALDGLGLPVVAELAVGHAPSSRLLPLGCPARLDVTAGSLIVTP